MAEDKKQKYLELKEQRLAESALQQVTGGTGLLGEDNLYLYYYGVDCTNCGSGDTMVKIYEYDSYYIEVTTCNSCGHVETVRANKW